jgi:hypothetical protein
MLHDAMCTVLKFMVGKLGIPLPCLKGCGGTLKISNGKIKKICGKKSSICHLAKHYRQKCHMVNKSTGSAYFQPLLTMPGNIVCLY